MTATLNRRGRSGFTLIELLVVIAIIAILASLLLPSIAKTKQKASGIFCMNNHHQLLIAWRMYADDNTDRITFADGPVGDGSNPVPGVWVSGLLDFDGSNPSNWDVNQDLVNSALWNYAGKSSSVWKCPADRSFVIPTYGPLKGRRVQRVRTMTMNIWMGGLAGRMDVLGSSYAKWRCYTKTSEILDPGPSKTFVLLDQREDVINTGTFGTEMEGYPDRPEARKFMQDLPASYHLRAGGLSFADGHAEIKRWMDPRTTPPVKIGERIPLDFIPSPNNPDIFWLQDRCTRRIK